MSEELEGRQESWRRIRKTALISWRLAQILFAPFFILAVLDEGYDLDTLIGRAFGAAGVFFVGELLMIWARWAFGPALGMARKSRPWTSPLSLAFYYAATGIVARFAFEAQREGRPLLEPILDALLLAAIALVMLAVFAWLLRGAMRLVLQLIGLGRWSCHHGFHLMRRIPTKFPQIGLGYTRYTFLALNGRAIEKCSFCEKYEPPEGAGVFAEWAKTVTIREVAGPGVQGRLYSGAFRAGLRLRQWLRPNRPGSGQVERSQKGSAGPKR